MSKSITQSNQDLNVKICQKINNNYNIYYYDNEWQKPVITEYQTFKLFYEKNNIPNNYFAFPWATLIDKKLKNEDILDNFKIEDKICFTVIQHIHFRRYFDLYKKIGITHIFTSHRQPSDDLLEKQYNVKLIPYSLFPAQFDNDLYVEINKRTYLTSFIGQYEDYYLTKIRCDIFNIFSKYSDCYIIERKGWHYRSIVYENKETTERENEEIEYKKVLSESIFSLCPSGSGPNSIRIWESMGYGTIPIILADTLILPKINGINWEDYFILYEESKINNLHDYLLLLSPEKIKNMSQNNIVLFNKYFSKESISNLIIDWFSNTNAESNIDLNNIPIISYCCSTFPNIGGVARYDTQLKTIFPHKLFFEGPKDKLLMLDYLSTIKHKNPIIITDNHLACDIPNEYSIILVHHGCAITHAEREPMWDTYWKDLCCNGQTKMLYYRNPINTQIISISQFCTDEFTKYYGEKYHIFNNKTILHTSEFNETIYKNYFNDFPIVFGNWATENKGSKIITELEKQMTKFKFKNLSISFDVNESLINFNNRKQQLYINADIFLQISLCEGNSYATLDALLCGLVIVSSNVGLFYNNIPTNCFVKLDWTRNNDIKYVQEQIEYAWNNKEFYSFNARKWYMENLRFASWKEQMSNCVIQFYKKTLANQIKNNREIQYNFYISFLNKYDKYINNVLMLNPTDADFDIFNDVFKYKNKNTKNIDTWNLNNKINEQYDLILINHTMMYSINPSLWFSNVFNSCKFVIITDLIDRKRGGINGDITDQFNDTTDNSDCMRYCFTHLNKISKNKIKYDLSIYKNRIVDIQFYYTNYTKEDANNLPESFICLFKGNNHYLSMNNKIIRIDDFPTGIRPILNELEYIYTILDEFEKNKIFYVLGIVPTLLTNDMINRLKKYNFMIPACHGYNHNYNISSQLLIENNDLFNEHTCMKQFNEFENNTEDEILNKLNEAKQILSKFSPIFTYIPPCNLIDEKTIKILEKLDCKCIYGDINITNVNSPNIPIIRSDFYGHLYKLDDTLNYNNKVITLHVTWEYDVIFRKKCITFEEWQKKLVLLK